MPTLRELFRCGFDSTWAGNYFQSLDLLRHYVDFNLPALKEKVGVEIKQLDGRANDAAARLVSVQRLAEQVRVIMMPTPQFPEAFFSWSRMCFSGFNEKLREDTPPGIAFRIGYHTGEILSECQLLTVILQLSSAVPGVPAFEPQWESCAKNIQRSLKQLKAASQMAMLVPKGPAALHDELYVWMSEHFTEIAHADVDFSNVAYLHLLTSKIQTAMQAALAKVEQAESLVNS